MTTTLRASSTNTTTMNTDNQVTTQSSSFLPGFMSTSESNKNDTISSQDQQFSDIDIVPLITVAMAAVLILVVASLILSTILLLRHKKRTQKLKIESTLERQDDSYSTLDGTKNQLQTQTLNVPTDLYDQIQLSPSTGQSEPISRNENEKINVMNSLSSVSHHMQKTNITKAKSDAIDAEKSDSEDLIYAVVDKEKKKWEKMEKSKTSKDNILQMSTN